MTLTGTCVGFILLNCTFTGLDAPAAVCPPLRTWAKSFQGQVAKELRAAPDSAMAKVVIGAIGDRDAARACRKANKR